MHWLSLILFLLLGVGLGGVYFGGLWVTVRHLRKVEHPKLLLLVSFLARTAFVLVSFYLILQWMHSQWEAIGFTLLGFMGGRWLLIRRWKPRPASSSRRIA